VLPNNTRTILITFPNEASYAIYGPLVWHVAHRLPAIDARILRRQIEELTEQLTARQVLKSLAEREPKKKKRIGNPPVTRRRRPVHLMRYQLSLYA
jgi:hypothetical protein